MSTESTTPPAASAAKRVILVADDYADDIERVTHYLPKRYGIVTAASYEEARSILESRHVALAIVDLFLDDTNMVPYGIKLLQEFKHVPFMMMSGKDGGDTGRALQGYEEGRLRLLSKDRDLDSRAQVEREVEQYLGRNYNMDLDFEFRRNLSWHSLASQLAGREADGIDERALEIEMLVRRVLHNWDISQSEHIRAKKVVLEDLIHSGDNSTVIQLCLWSATSAQQAEVVLKITTKPREASKFSEFRHVLGGFGLHELSYMRSCRYDAQIYSVPYYKYAQTATYRTFYVNSTDDSGALARIREVTHHLFNEALGHLSERAPTSRGEMLLAEYYGQRFDVTKRVAAIQADLLPASLPGSARMSGDGATLSIRIGSKKADLRHPLQPVLIDRVYPGSGMRMNTALRHGDLHAGNVLVDANRHSAWFIDYDDFGTGHFSLADHVEMEASLLFSAMSMSADLPFWARFTEAIAPRADLTAIEDVSGDANSDTDRREARKAIEAIRVIRKSASRDESAESPGLYYHALMYEALRAAGARSKDNFRRWHALITAAQLLERLT
jgi:CheY-like chemotaxis protein